LLKTAFQLFADLVFCESAEIFPLEKGSREKGYSAKRHFKPKSRNKSAAIPIPSRAFE
jgi:hypothetical protein